MYWASSASAAGNTLMATSRFSLLSRARYNLAHAAPAESREDLVRAELVAYGQRHEYEQVYRGSSMKRANSRIAHYIRKLASPRGPRLNRALTKPCNSAKGPLGTHSPWTRYTSWSGLGTRNALAFIVDGRRLAWRRSGSSASHLQ
jgi:hypothetical protein